MRSLHACHAHWTHLLYVIIQHRGYFEGIQLDVIPVSNVANAIATREIVAYNASTSSIALPADNNRYQIFNVNFDALVRDSLHEVITGVTALPSGEVLKQRER